MIQLCILKNITFFLIILKFQSNSRPLFGRLKVNLLWIGLFLACPPMVAWALHEHDDEKPSTLAVMKNVARPSNVRIPVEVVAKGGKTEWMMVEVPVETIPEPGTTTLLMTLSSLLLLRRKREE